MHCADAVLFLLCASAMFSNAFRKQKTTSSFANNLAHRGSRTHIHFELPPEVGEHSTLMIHQENAAAWECGADTPSPFWGRGPRPHKSKMLNIPSGDEAWDAELDVLLAEPAIAQVWSQAMEVWDCKGTSFAKKATALLSKEVPGMPGVTFQKVFDTLHTEGCPVWILGGSVRDLLTGKSPKDVDTSSLCRVSQIHKVITDNGWKGYSSRKFKYYEIGTRGAEDGMEGKSIDTLYTHPSIVDWTANMLLLDPRRMHVIDPSGRGISDAKAFRLTPATPPPIDWYTWKEHETQLRHYRYLKFRLRGWEPYDDCFRYYMANEIVTALMHEATDPDYQSIIFLFLVEQLKDESKRMSSKLQFLNVLEEDLTRGYFEKGRKVGRECGIKNDTKSLLDPSIANHASGLHVFHKTLVEACKHPSDIMKAKARKKRLDITEACDLIVDFYKWARGGGYTYFTVGDAVFFKARDGKLYEGKVTAIHKARKQIDWAYDIADDYGKTIQRKATAKRVLGREQ